jgi:ABC-type lipoprotein export system ATPase subunit
MSTITGKIKAIGQTETFGANGFQKRTVVVTTEEQYPQHIEIEFVQGNCALLDNRSVDENVKITYALKGREWHDTNNNKLVYFNTIQGWKIETA